MRKYYAGIGSRQTPESFRTIIGEFATALNRKGYVLRSGGATGADSMFEEFADEKEIFLPWPGYNGNTSTLVSAPEEAYEMARKYHPVYDTLGQGAKHMMARNCMQILGADLKTPVDFVICWTKDGKASGGTGQAIRLANDLGIPVYNLYNETDRLYLRRILFTPSLF
jgi:hypothetical protein